MATTPAPRVDIVAAYAADLALRKASAGTPIFDQLVAEYTAQRRADALAAVRAAQ